MDSFINKLQHKSAHGNQAQPNGPSSSGGGFMGNVNNMAGGGHSGEKKEDALDKGVDWVQQHVFKQGSQTNESAVEQAKDERISDTIRDQFKKHTGKNIPIADK